MLEGQIHVSEAETMCEGQNLIVETGFVNIIDVILLHVLLIQKILKNC